jgi:short-subunit dehydrogenase
MQVEGARVLVTGASSGIGATLAVLLAERGATVGIVGRREDRLAEVLARCQAHVPESRSWALDLGDTAAAAALVLEAWDAFGHLDVLVNNAGMPKRRDVRELTFDEVRTVQQVNFDSPVRMSLAVLPRMLERNAGIIVNVSSFGGRAGIIHEAAYCASKFALCGWSESMALDLWHTGVDVQLVLPGAIATDIWDRPGNEPAPYAGPFEPPEVVAEGIIAGLENGGFEHYLPDMKPIVELKTSAIEDFMAGVIEFTESQADGPG